MFSPGNKFDKTDNAFVYPSFQGLYRTWMEVDQQYVPVFIEHSPGLLDHSRPHGRGHLVQNGRHDDQVEFVIGIWHIRGVAQVKIRIFTQPVTGDLKHSWRKIDAEHPAAGLLVALEVNSRSASHIENEHPLLGRKHLHTYGPQALVERLEQGVIKLRDSCVGIHAHKNPSPLEIFPLALDMFHEFLEAFLFTHVLKEGVVFADKGIIDESSIDRILEPVECFILHSC
jgi:hypothetical protein